MILECNENTKRQEIMKVIKHIMIDENLKNADVIDKLGMSKQTVSNLLNPNYRPDTSIQIDSLCKIVDAIGYKLELHFVPVGTAGSDK